MKMKIAPTLLMLAALVVAAVAVPAMAQPEDRGRPADAGRPEGAGARHDHGNATDRANHTRGPPAHAMDRLEARCDAVENATGHRPAACDRLAQIHDGEHRARRAAHAGLGALAAWEHLNETLSKLEARFEAKLAAGNLTENETAAFQAKLDKIDAMQERLALRISAMEARIADIESRHEAVRDHVEARRAARGDDAVDDPSDASESDAADDGDDGNETVE